MTGRANRILTGLLLLGAVHVLGCGASLLGTDDDRSPKALAPDKGEPRADSEPVDPAEAPGSPVPAEPEATPVQDLEGEADLARAEVARATADGLGQRRILAQLAQRSPASVQGREACVRMAEEAAHREDWDAALSWAGRCTATIPDDGDHARRLALVLGMAYGERERDEQAMEAFVSAAEGESAPAMTQAARLGRFETLLRMGRLGEARELMDGLPKGTDHVARWLAELGDQDLDALASAIQPGDPWACRVIDRAAHRACGRGDLPWCQEHLDDGGACEAAEGFAKRSLLRTEARAWDEVDPKRIGVLLPLEGRHGKLGKMAQEAIALAWKDDRSIVAIPWDTRGEAERAAKGVRSLVLEHRVVAILGPLGRLETRAASEEADRWGVPLVSLTSHREAVAPWTMAVRIRLSSNEHAAALARHVVLHMELNRIAVLHPDTRHGRAVMASFWDELVRVGGEVRAVAAYGSDKDDPAKALRSLVGPPVDEGERALDFEALFLPEPYALRVRRLVRMMPASGISPRTAPVRRRADRGGIQLLGLSGWHHPAVIDPGDHLTDNAVFVDGYAHDPDARAHKRFAHRFLAAYGRKPTGLEAVAYDAATLLSAARKVATSTDHSARKAVLDALMSTRHFSGITGRLSLLEGGRLMTRPKLLTVDFDQIRPRLSEPEERAVRRRGSRPGAR